MDTRQARGAHLAQLHGERIRPVEGDLWFVPSSDGAGGYLVNVAATGPGRCSCQDAQRVGKCKHVWAVETVREAQGALPAAGGAAMAPAPPGPPTTPARPLRSDLTVEEQARVRTGLRFAQRRAGGWEGLAKGTRLAVKTLKHVAYGQMVTASVAVRLARFAGVPVDDVLQGRYPPVCPHCGQAMLSRP